MERKVTGILLILLALSLEFNSILLIRRVSAQPEELAKKLEDCIGKAIPEELLAEECEYVVPEGFSNTLAERLWKDLSFYVSAGYTTSELRGELRRIYGNSLLVNATLSNGKTVMLNLSGTAVERNIDDGSVSIMIPVASSGNLSYVKYNFTKTAGFYEAWNKTLVREYRVWRREPGWYTYTMSFLETNRSVRIVSRIWGMESETSFTKVERVEWTKETGEIPIFTHAYYGGTIIVAIPGHYEDVRVVVPEQKRNFKVLFPAYDPLIQFGWVISTSISSTSLSVEETLQISYWVEYYSFSGEEPPPLNATLTLSAPDAFESLNGFEHRLNDEHKSGSFRLRAVKPGTYNLTLTLTGNASFSNILGNEVTYEVQVVSPPAPSLSVTILGVNTTILKHAGLTLRLTNNGGSTAKNVNVEIAGTYWDEFKYVDAFEKAGRSLGDVEAGETRIEEFMLRLRHSSAEITVKTTYSDDDGNPYMVKAYTSIYHPSFWVPEHFETYTVTLPEHEETLRVFVPSYEKATHVRLYALWDPYIVGAALPYMRYGWVYEAREPAWGVGVPTHVPTLGLDSMPIPGVGAELPFEEGEEALRKAGVKIMVKSIEPYYEYLGILKEDEALRLVNTDKESLRSGNLSSDFRVEPLKPYWVKASSIVLNSTELALYQATMEGLKKKNPDIDYEFRETIADVRTRVREAEPGYVVLVYHPLKVVGEGPLKSVRVRNFARIDFNYRVDVETFIPTFLGKVSGGREWKYLYLNGKEDAVLLSASLDTQKLEVSVNLTYNGKLVAHTRFILEPESSPFWRGFWDAILLEKMPSMIISTAIIIIIGATTGGAGAVLAMHIISCVTAFTLHYVIGSKSNVEQIAEAWNTLNFIDKLIENATRLGRVLESIKWNGLASNAFEAAKQLEEKKTKLIVDTGLDLTLGITWTDIMRAAGLEEASEYERGHSTGKIVGTIFSFLIYTTALWKLDNLKGAIESGTLLSSVKQALLNWITPPLLDAAILGVKIHMAVEKWVSRIITWRKVSADYEDYVSRITMPDGGEEDTLKLMKKNSDIFEKAVEVAMGKDEDFARKLLDLFARYLKMSGEEDTCIKALENMKRMGDEELIRRLVDWLKEIPERHAVKLYPFESGVKFLAEDGDVILKAWSMLTGKYGEGSFDNFLRALGMAFQLSERGDEIISKIKLSTMEESPEWTRFLSDVFGEASRIRELFPSDSKERTRFIDYLLQINSGVEKLRGEQIDEVTGILLKIFSKRTVIEEDVNLGIFHRFRENFLKITGEKNIDFELLRDYLGKWRIAADLLEAIVSKLDYQHDTEKGDRYFMSVPSGTRYILTDGNELIPVWTYVKEGEPEGDATVPRDVVTYLNLKEGSYVIAMAVGERLDDGRVRLSDGNMRDVIAVIWKGEDPVVQWNLWFQRIFKDTPYVEDHTINWKKLDEDNMIPSFILEGPGGAKEVSVIPQGDYIKTYVSGSVAGENEYVLLRNPHLIKFEARELLRNWLKERNVQLPEELITDIARMLRRVIMLPVEQGDNILENENDKGSWGEWRVFTVIYRDVEAYREKVTLGGEETDIDWVAKALVEVKNWVEKSYHSGKEELIKKLRIYKFIHDNGYEDKGKGITIERGKMVILVFYKSLGENLVEDLKARLTEEFGELSWLMIYNGYEEFISKYSSLG